MICTHISFVQVQIQHLAYRLSSHTPKLRYTANVTQSRYGICSHTASLSTLWKDRIMRRISIHNAISQRNANPKFWRLKKMILQKKLKASWIRKSSKLRDRALDAGARYIRAAPIPIKANRMPQTIGNTILGGDSGGCSMVAL